MGSLPGESTKMRGVTAFESLKLGSIEKGIGSTYLQRRRCETLLCRSAGVSARAWCNAVGVLHLAPRASLTKADMAGTTLSGRTVRSTTMRWNGVRRFCQG